MGNKLKKILEHAVEKGWEMQGVDLSLKGKDVMIKNISAIKGRLSPFVTFLESSGPLSLSCGMVTISISELIREPKHGLLKAIYGDRRKVWNGKIYDANVDYHEPMEELSRDEVEQDLSLDQWHKLISNPGQIIDGYCSMSMWVGWEEAAQRFSTMPLEEVIDELYQYVINLKNNE